MADVETDETVDLLGYLGKLKQYWVPAAVVGLVTTLALALLGLRGAAHVVEVATKSHVLVSPQVAKTTAEADLQVQLMPQYMRTFVALEDVPAFTEQVSKDLGGRFTPEQVAEMTKVAWGGGSMLLAVEATAPNEGDSLALSQAGAEALVALGPEILSTPKDEMPKLTLVENAKLDNPDAQITPPSKLSGLTTAIPVGLAAAALTAFVLEWRGSRRRRTASR